MNLLKKIKAKLKSPVYVLIFVDKDKENLLMKMLIKNIVDAHFFII